MDFYSFGRTFFSNYIWIKGGQLFPVLHDMDIEFISVGSFAVEIYTAAGKLRTRHTRDNAHGGWNSFDLRWDITPIESYKLRLVNTSSTPTHQVLQGVLRYGSL